MNDYEFRLRKYLFDLMNSDTTHWSDLHFDISEQLREQYRNSIFNYMDELVDADWDDLWYHR